MAHYQDDFLVYEAASGLTLAVCLVCAEITLPTEHPEHLKTPSADGLSVLAAFYEYEHIDRIMGWEKI
jgi:hypothetical protein